MKIRHVSGAFSLFLFFCLSAQAELDPLQVWTASGGEARLELRADYLPDFGLEIVHEGRAVREIVEIRHGFTDSDQLIIEAPYGNFERFVTGEIRLDTGWVLRHEGREVRLDGLRLRPDLADQGHPKLQVLDGEGRHVFTFSHLHIKAEHERDLLTVHNMDISAGPALPTLLDMPVLSELHLGMAWLDMPLQVPEGADTSGLGVDVSDRGLSCTGRPFFPQEYGTHGEVVDVGLIQIGQVAYQGMDGGTGRIKVAPSARLKNLSGGDASWIPKFTTEPFYPYEPRDQHPFLVWNMYRIADGRIQQLGASGVKHAFLTINQSCTINCGSSHVLWPGCEDVYGTGTNDSNSNQGPREDIIASESLFFSTCSFFDPGCNGSQTNNSTSFQNRLMVDPAQLQTPGADYFLDAWYVVMADHNIWNSMGYHGITPTTSGGGWSFGPLDPFTNGPVINEWVDPDNLGPDEDYAELVVPSATPNEPYPDNMPQGHIKVLVKVTEPEPGRYRYNYAVQNFDFDRGIEAFRIPISESAAIFEEFFGDIDEDEDNDWTISVQDGYVNFEAPEDNPLTWFTVFNFEIETDAPPTESAVTLDLGGDAVVPSMDADILGPEQGPVPLPGDVTLEPVFSGFSSPIALRHAGDGTHRKFVVQQNGQIRVIDTDDNVLPTPFLTLGSLVTTGGEQGLLGLAFHPNFATNGLFYLNYSAGTDRPAGTSQGDTIVAEFSVSDGDPNVANPAPERIILTVAQPAGNHNGGNILFGPDGYLYIGMGDGGGAGDTSNNAQTLSTLLGKMLRIDVDGDDFPGDDLRNYAIPASNPFVGDPALDEIWAYGLRNPWRWSFDRDTGDLLIGDVGQFNWEEIDFQPASSTGGENYGWRVLEGEHCFNDSAPGVDCDDFLNGGSVLPILEYSHAGGACSVTGGYRYRGPFPSLEGFYAYGDYCSGQVWLAQEAGGEWSTDEFDNVGGGITSFGEDEAGHLYLLRSNGDILRFEGEPDPAPVVAAVNPDEGPETGGTSVTLTGENFQVGADVTFGGNDCAGIDVVSDTEITCDTPPGAPGGVDVTVTNPDAQADTLMGGFTYIGLPPAITTVDPDEGPETGGTSVTLTGENFQAGAGVTFGGNACANIDVSDTEITCNTPPGAPGTVDVTVTNPDDQSDTLAGGFTYVEVVNPVPALSLSTGALDFGSVDVGDQSSLDVELESTGTATLEVSGLGLPGAPFSVDTSDCGGTTFDLAPGANCVLSVTFAPGAAGEFADELTIESNADSSPDAVALTGTGFQDQVPGELAVVPESVDFGDVTVDDNDTAFVTLSNVAPEGAAALSLDMVSIITGGDVFEIAGNDCGATLAAQMSCEVEIRFTPTEETAHAGLLRIVAGGATVNVALDGNGVEAAPTIFEDRFEELALLLKGALIGG